MFLVFTVPVLLVLPADRLLLLLLRVLLLLLLLRKVQAKARRGGGAGLGGIRGGSMQKKN